MDQEVHADPLTVNLSQDMQKPRLRATAVHRAENMKYANRFHVFAFSASR